jgi:hypothetical protein
MKIDLVYADDWVGLYIDNKLEMEGHSLRLGSVIELIKDKMQHRLDKIEAFSEVSADDDWIEERGNFPETFEEVKTNGNY